MVTSFGVLDVTDWILDALEPAGTDEKVWLAVPGGGRALFKPNRSRDAQDQGEDWAEKFAAEIAALLGLPAARIDLACRNGRRGCVSYDVKPVNAELQPGATLLSDRLGVDHDPRSPVGHSISNIRSALAGYGSPPGLASPLVRDGFDAFAGYLTFDALIANRDRHAENWSVLRWFGGTSEQRLAPTYDHASSLGFNLLDERRVQLLRDSRMMEAFLRKGDAYRFEGGRGVPLVRYAQLALAESHPESRRYWLDRIATLREPDVAQLAERIPTMSDQARILATRLIVTNRRRLLDD